MADDPFKPVSPGEVVKFSASAFNLVLDAAKAEKLRRHSFTSESSPQPAHGNIVRVKNASGSDLVRNSVVGLEEPIFLPADSEEAFRKEVLFSGVIPNSNHKGRFGILLDPLKYNDIGWCYVDGVAPVKLHVTDNDHTCCDIDEGSTDSLLTVESNGSAGVLWKEDGTGIAKWGVVRFGVACGCGSLEVTVNRCSGSTLVIEPGATLTLLDNTGATVDTCVTDSSGICNFTISAAGHYRVRAEKSGLATFEQEYDLTCEDREILMIFQAQKIKVFGCNGLPVPGATVVLTVAGIPYSKVTDFAGLIYLPTTTVAVNVPFTVSHPRFTGRSSVLNLFGCNTTANVTIGDASGGLNPALFHCMSGSSPTLSCGTPLPNTLYLSDSRHGITGLVLTYSVTFAGWRGFKASHPFPACPAVGCTAQVSNLEYIFNQAPSGGAQANITVGYNGAPIPGGGSGGCPGGGGLQTIVFPANTTLRSLQCLPFHAEWELTHPYFYCGGTSTVIVTE